MIRYVLASLLLCGPVVAGEPCPGSNIGDIVAKIEAAGGRMIDLVDVNAVDFDQLLIADYNGSVVIGGFRANCPVGGPIALSASVKQTGV